MDYKTIEKAVKEMVTTDIKGKPYPEVVEKIKAFRKCYPHGTIETELLSDNDGRVVFKAIVSDEGTVLGIGHAYEKESSSYINKTSYIENCETSAVGRALSMAGFGGDKSVSGLEEVAHAMVQQDEMKSQEIGKQKINETKQKALLELCHNENIDVTALCKLYKVNSFGDITEAMYSNIANHLPEIKQSCGKENK
jgi:hypothetical protein